MILFVGSACVGGGSGAPAATGPTAVAPPTAATTPLPSSPAAPSPRSSPPPPAATGAPDCGSVDGVAFEAGAAVDLAEIATTDEVTVYAAEYPLPDQRDGLWSQWGQGAVAPSTGRHYSAVGDHRGADGNSWFFEYDPTSRTLTRLFDVLALVDHQPGAWGYGKVHAQMVADDCGALWAATYWGTKRDLEYGQGYEGDLLLQIDPVARTVRNHGAVAGARGIPSMTVAGGRVVAEAVDPESSDGQLVVVDARTGAATHRVEDGDHHGFRSLAVDAAGRVLYSVEGAQLGALDPMAGETTDPDIDLPTDDEDDFLRAATPAGPDGHVIAVTQESETLFRLGPAGAVTEVASAGGYTASLAVTPEGERVYWLAGAHGDAWEDGATVQVLDTDTGTVSDVVSLRDPFEDELGLLPGGTYSAVYDDGRLVLGVNASPLDDESGFGTVVLVVIEGL